MTCGRKVRRSACRCSPRVWSTPRSRTRRATDPPSEAQAPDHLFVEQALRDLTSKGGLPPAEVAGLVFDAVRSGRFYITTTDVTEQMLRERFDAVVAGEFPPPAQFDR